MSDLDEEDEDFGLTKFGTALPELEDDAEPKKPIAIHEQIATDLQGRRRFHGAFTGGFSAGYYNTVSTKDGWTPSSFRSSRTDRKEKRKMEPEDFMDEEDTSEFGIAPKKIFTQTMFSSEKSDGKISNAEKFSKNATMILGMNMLQTLITPVSNNIGIKLLRRMGWKPGQGIGPRVKRRKIEEDEYIPPNMTFPPEDTVQIDFTAKDNINGLGYTGLDPKLALHDKVKKSSAISLKTKAGMKLSFTGQAFGVGAYEEEEEDIYAQDSMANYDLVMNEERKDNTYGWSKPTKAIAGQNNIAISYVREVLEGYHKVIKSIRRKCYPPPLLPPDFDPNKRLRLKGISQNTQEQENDSENHENSDKFHQPDPEDKRTLLGKEKMLHKKELVSNKSVFTFINPDDCKRLKRIKSDLSQEKSISNLVKPKRPQEYEPFSSDAAKQSRYQQYMSALRAKKSDPYSHVKHDLDMTEWERHQEQEEFQKSSRFFQPLSATMASRFTNESDELREQDEKEKSLKKAASLKMFGFMTRESFEWHPDSLLCKRFNVPSPYTNCDFVGIRNDSSSQTKGMFLDPSDFEKKTVAETPSEDKAVDSKISTGKVISDSLLPLRSKGDRRIKAESRWDKEPPLQGPEPAPAEEIPSENATEENDDAEESEQEETTQERPSLDIFKAIFENSDDNESEEEIASENEEHISEIPKIQPGKLVETSLPRHIFHVKKDEEQTNVIEPDTSPHLQSQPEAEMFGPVLPPVNVLMKQADMVFSNKKCAKKAKKKKKHKHKEKKK